MPRLHRLLLLSSVIICCNCGSASGEQPVSYEGRYNIDYVECTGELPHAQLDILKQGIWEIGTFLLEQDGDGLTFHYQEPRTGKFSTRVAWHVNFPRFGWVGYSVQIAFAERPDPNDAMYGFGWGAVPTYSEVSISISGHFSADDTITFTDSYAFGNSPALRAQCEHDWIREKKHDITDITLAYRRLRMLENRLDAMERRLEQLEAESGQ